MSFVHANGLALFVMLTGIILIEYNLVKYIIIALFITGILQWVISGYTDLMAIAIMLGFFTVIVTTNDI